MVEEVDYDAGRVLEALNDKVDRDFGNVPSNFVNFAKYSKNVTNCITEIPQDIKLELNNGTLTLKAGSKVYIPNGFEADGVTRKFDVVIIESDLSTTTVGNNTGAKFISFVKELNGIYTQVVSDSISGATPPSEGGLFYDTTNNEIDGYFKDKQGYHYSLPLGIVIVDSNNSFASIDQVFNGFSYIGSTVFALPGVKGLMPNGRNPDGTLRNIEYTTQNVLLYTFEQNWSGNPVVFSISKEENEVRLRPSYYFFEQGTIPSKITSSQWLNTESNLLYQTYSDAVSWSNAFLRQAFICGSFFITSEAKVSNFNHKTAFRALDYSDRETVVGWGMPDYSARVSVAVGVKTKASVDSIYLGSSGGGGGADSLVSVQLYDERDNLVIKQANRYQSTGNTSDASVSLFVPKGYSINIDYGRNILYSMLCPLKGVN